MNEENTKINNAKGKAKFPTTLIISIFVIFLVFYWLFIPYFPSHHGEQTPLTRCRVNMKQLGLGFQIYAYDNSDSYPPPDKWCDLISPYLGSLAENIFCCPAVRERDCDYAMNPDCEPNSPPETVLLFETQESGWNLSGGPELLSTENHGGSGCNIVFNDGSSTYVKTEEIPNLKWSGKRNNE